MPRPRLIDQDVSETLRLAKLASLDLLDTAEENEFDTVVALAKRLLDCPIALVSLVDDHRQWFKARCGLDATETPRDQAFCAHAIYVDDIMVVEDATRDPRFAANPLVTGPPYVRFYAGVPLRPAASGFVDDLPGIGTLCVIDTKPRRLSESDAALLRGLASLVNTVIQARASAATAVRLSTEATAQAAALARKHQQLHQAERMAGIGSWRLDLATQTVEWSDQVSTIHGLPRGVFPSLDDALGYYPENDRARIAELLERGANHGEPFDFESDLLTADGRIRRVRSIGEPEMVDGLMTGLLGVFQDITDHHRREETLRHVAETDPLTGLANRASLDARLDDALSHAQASGDPFALLLLDLDGFKQVNDALGHEKGDDVLRETARRLGTGCFANAFSARLGGDEFVVLVTRPRDCADLDQYIAGALAELRQTLGREGQHRKISATIGAAMFDSTIRSKADLLRRADLALYAAKRDARGTGRIDGAERITRITVAGTTPIISEPLISVPTCSGLPPFARFALSRLDRGKRR